MRARTALLSLAIASLLTAARADATTTSSGPAGTSLPAASGVALASATPRGFRDKTSAEKRHLFPVRDDKGLLLSCVAPELDTNRKTDLFKNCSLAPGRTLDEVMHSFIRAFNQVERQRQSDAAGADKDAAEQPMEKAAQK